MYRATESFPRQEVFGLTAQMRSAALSVPANVAEGQARRSSPDFIRFLRIALGSLAELETYLDIAHALRYLSAEDRHVIVAESDEITKMLHGLIASLRADDAPS